MPIRSGTIPPKCDYAANGGDRAHNQPSLVNSGWARVGPIGMAFADGSVQRIAYDVNADLFRWLGNRRDGPEHSSSGL